VRELQYEIQDMSVQLDVGVERRGEGAQAVTSNLQQHIKSHALLHSSQLASQRLAGALQRQQTQPCTVRLVNNSQNAGIEHSTDERVNTADVAAACKFREGALPFTTV
jgi:hypothetical protein